VTVPLGGLDDVGIVDGVVPVLFFSLLAVGVAVILARYVLSGSVSFFDKDVSTG
jgi:hypothetical protein